MNPTDTDPTRRLTDADPLRGQAVDDPSSATAHRVLERALAPEPALLAAGGTERRWRPSRFLPVVAVAAAALAVIGLSLPKGTPDAVRNRVGSQPASAEADRADLLRAARRQDAKADDVPAAQRASQQQFLDGLTPFPTEPTGPNVLAWLDANCVDIIGEVPTDLDCGLAAVPDVFLEAPAPVVADVLRALATLDLGAPTHAGACDGWDAVDPAWRKEVERAEAALVWVGRKGSRLVVWTARGGEDFATSVVAARGASVSPGQPSAATEPFVQCRPSSELQGHPERTVEGALAAYARSHGLDGCALNPAEQEGLVAVDLAAACGGSSISSGQSSGDEPMSSDDESGTPTTSIADPGEVTTTSMGG